MRALCHFFLIYLWFIKNTVPCKKPDISKKAGCMMQPAFFDKFSGVPGAIRTRGLSLRRRTLYPAELRRQIAFPAFPRRGTTRFFYFTSKCPVCQRTVISARRNPSLSPCGRRIPLPPKAHLRGALCFEPAPQTLTACPLPSPARFANVLGGIIHRGQTAAQQHPADNIRKPMDP